MRPLLPILLLASCAVAVDDDDVPAGPTHLTLTGSATWAVDFDADAEAAGAVDCAYTRHYVGAEDGSVPWACPECEVLVRAEVQSLDGLECYRAVSGADATPAATELLGRVGSAFRRSGGGPLQALGTVDVDGDSWGWHHQTGSLDTPVGGTMSFEITGSFTLGTASGAPAQVVAADSYDCGWPRSELTAYDGDYRVTVGGQLPGGVFLDRCGDFVELRHFLGRYLVVDVSAIDCPPCQGMAQAEPAFLAQIEAEGIDVEVVTLLAPSLADTAGTPTQAELAEWTDYFHLESPVLADRFWGLGTIEPVIPDEYAYPSVVVVAPDGEVLSLSTGFSNFDGYADTIRAHRQ